MFFFVLKLCTISQGSLFLFLLKFPAQESVVLISLLPKVGACKSINGICKQLLDTSWVGLPGHYINTKRHQLLFQVLLWLNSAVESYSKKSVLATLTYADHCRWQWPILTRLTNPSPSPRHAIPTRNRPGLTAGQSNLKATHQTHDYIYAAYFL